MTTAASSIEDKLNRTFSPSFLRIEDDSYRHRNHSGKMKGAGGHFSVILVSEQFAGIPHLDRHKKVFQTVQDCEEPIHALALKTYTPEEWKKKAVSSS